MILISESASIQYHIVQYYSSHYNPIMSKLIEKIEDKVKKIVNYKYEREWADRRLYSGCKSKDEQIVYTLSPITLDPPSICGCTGFPCDHLNTVQALETQTDKTHKS